MLFRRVRNSYLSAILRRTIIKSFSIKIHRYLCSAEGLAPLLHEQKEIPGGRVLLRTN